MWSARMATPGGAKVHEQATQAPPGGAHGSVAQTHRVFQKRYPIPCRQASDTCV
jgi:hypothetical protein